MHVKIGQDINVFLPLKMFTAKIDEFLKVFVHEYGIFFSTTVVDIH